MTPFEVCVAKTLDIERGYVDDTSDAGGATNFGVSLRFLKTLIDADKNGYADGDIDQDGDVDADDIKALTMDKVYEILKIYFWNELPFKDSLMSLEVKWKVFDISVHCSPVRAIKLLQKALSVESDGLWGIKSDTALCCARTDSLLCALSREQMKFYATCIINRPANLKFLKNWTWRAFEQMEI